MNTKELDDMMNKDSTERLCHIVRNALMGVSDRLTRMQKEIQSACTDIDKLIEKERGCHEKNST